MKYPAERTREDVSLGCTQEACRLPALGLSSALPSQHRAGQGCRGCEGLWLWETSPEFTRREKWIEKLCVRSANEKSAT